MNLPRFFCPAPLASDQLLSLPPNAARHVQVLRLQPGREITLFNGAGGEWQALIEQMGRSEVTVRVGAHDAVEREAALRIHLAIGMPANERMDWLIEKATELGVASLQPLLAARGVLKLTCERAARKQAHWQAIAVAACEQCGRNRVPVVHPPADFTAWCAAGRWEPTALRLLLSLDAQAATLTTATPHDRPIVVLSGPEGGLDPREEQAALMRGFVAVTLGPRVLRAETAPLAALAALTLAGPAGHSG